MNTLSTNCTTTGARTLSILVPGLHVNIPSDTQYLDEFVIISTIFFFSNLIFQRSRRTNADNLALRKAAFLDYLRTYKDELSRSKEDNWRRFVQDNKYDP